jgi:hypothetical protein
MHLLTARDWAGAPHLLAALLMLAVAVALLFATIGGGAEEPLPYSPPTAPSAGARPQIAVRAAAAGESVAVAGASFRTLSDPERRWARQIRRRDAGAGRRWVLAAVEVENVGRRHFNPGLLSYLLRAPGGAILAPYRAGVVGPAGLGTAGGLPRGGRAEERLVYRIPRHLGQPRLAIQPSPTRALEIRVPLGGR